MILDLTTGKTVTFEEAAAALAPAKSELERAEELIETLVAEREELVERVRTLEKMVTYGNWCTGHQLQLGLH